MAATIYIPVYTDIHFFIEIDYKNAELQIYLKIQKTLSNTRAQRPMQFHFSF